MAPTFRELLRGTDVSFVQASVSSVDLEKQEVSLIGTVADDIDGFVISDNEDEGARFGFCTVRTLVVFVCLGWLLKAQVGQNKSFQISGDLDYCMEQDVA